MRIVTLVVVLASVPGPSWADRPAARAAPVKQPAIPAAAAARLPETGRLVAYSTYSELVIARLTRTGPKELLRRETSAATGWLDPRTLVAVEPDTDGNVAVRWFVDGVHDAGRDLAHKPDAWALKKGEQLSGHRVFRAGGGLWVEGCLKQVDGEQGCRKATWLRVDVSPARPARARPARAVLLSAVAAPTAVKPPAGFTAKVVKLKRGGKTIGGVECSSATGTTKWSEDAEGSGGFAPKQVRWVHITPPIYAVSGVETNPIGWTEPASRYFRACAQEPLGDFAWLGGGLWASGDSDDKLTVYVDDQPIAVFEGHHLTGAPG